VCSSSRTPPGLRRGALQVREPRDQLSDASRLQVLPNDPIHVHLVRFPDEPGKGQKAPGPGPREDVACCASGSPGGSPSARSGTAGRRSAPAPGLPPGRRDPPRPIVEGAMSGVLLEATQVVEQPQAPGAATRSASHPGRRRCPPPPGGDRRAVAYFRSWSSFRAPPSRNRSTWAFESAPEGPRRPPSSPRLHQVVQMRGGVSGTP
jgi:hypothetical protein